MAHALIAPDRDLTAHELMRTYLRDRERHLYPKLDLGALERMVAALGSGADHIAGERILAQMAFMEDTRGGGLLGFVANLFNPIAWFVRAATRQLHWDHGALFTDRRMVARDWVEAVDAPYKDITAISYSGGFGAFFGWENLRINVCGEHSSIAAPAPRAMGKFLIVMSEQVRQGRVARPAPYRVAAREGDPTGALGAIGAIDRDHRAEILLDGIAIQHQAGRLTGPAALMLTQQVWLLSRTTTGGRGMSEDLWISPLCRADLLAFFGTKMGRAVPVDAVDGYDTLQFDRNRSHARIDFSGVLLKSTGYFDVRLPRGDVRIQIRDMDGPAGRWTGYRLLTHMPEGWAPYHEGRASLFRLHKMLLKYEGRLLLRRVLFPGADPFAVPIDDVQAALGDVVPDGDYRMFRRSRTQIRLKKMVKDPPPTKSLRPEQVPGRLPRPKGREPTTIGLTVLMHLAAGMTTSVVMPMPICCGGSVLIAQISQLFLEPVLGLSPGIAGVLILLMYANLLFIMFVLGPIRILTAFVFLADPRRLRPLMLISSGIGVVGGVFGDLPGAAASAMTLLLMHRHDVREYYDLD